MATTAAMSGNGSFPQTNEELEANATRIVECVNACEGIENPGGLKLLLQDLRRDAGGVHESSRYAKALLSYLSHE